jgi:thiol-disulfide isomerase/thioredoxin
VAQTTLVKSFLPILIVLGAATAYGFWYQKSRGKIQAKAISGSALTASVIGGDLGSRATLVQFSSAFCTPCRATRTLLENVVTDLNDVRHVEIDAETNLELVRKLDIRSTPTTLILNSFGVEVGRAVGAPKRDQVLAALAAIK